MKLRKKQVAVLIIIGIFFMVAASAYAEPITPFKFNIGVEPAENPEEVASSIQILLMLTVLSLAPSIIIMMTSFTRIIIILSFLRNALGTQQMPPNQILIGLALFLSLFVMTPVIQDINEKAYKPYTEEIITQQQALDESSKVIKGFMLKQMKGDGKDLALFSSLAGIKTDGTVKPEELPLTVIIPAFLINELTIAFKFGFIIFVPFLVIDMVVASTLMSMGMMMLPPVMISLPFKIILFILVGGWNLIAQSIIGTFVR